MEDQDRQPANTNSVQTGFSLLEGVITIGVVGILLVVMLGTLRIISVQYSAEHRSIARQLLAEESETIRNASFADLENRANMPFIEVAYNLGQWSVASPTGPRSAPNVYVVSGSATPSRQVVPAGTLDDGTYEAAIRIRQGSTSGWKAGFFVRYHDDQNHYLIRFSATTLEMIRVVEGVSTTLWTTNLGFAADTWYRITVAATGSSFTVSRDGVVQTGTPVADATFIRGQFVLGAFDGAAAEFDDVLWVGAASVAWNFDTNELVGAPARGWRRIGPGDLPQGTTNVTIANQESGYTDLKKVTASVSWYERGAIRSLSNEFFVNQRSVAP